MTNRKNRRLWVTIALLAAAAVLLLISGVNTANAALTYFSEDYKAQVDMYDIGVTLTENGTDVSYRNYTKKDDVWNAVLMPDTKNALLQNMVATDEQVHLGQAYKEEIGVRNSGTIDEYVRVSLYRYWTDADGSKRTDLDPEWIDLHLVENNGWVVDESATTKERTVLYYTSILASGATAPNLTDTLTINGDLAAKVTETETTDGTKTIITYTYDYEGVTFNIEAEVDAVQTHNAEDAIKSAWGVDVSIGSNGSLTLR